MEILTTLLGFWLWLRVIEIGAGLLVVLGVLVLFVYSVLAKK